MKKKSIDIAINIVLFAVCQFHAAVFWIKFEPTCKR